MNQQPPRINIDLSDAEDVKCDSCGNYTFVEVVMMKKVSALVSPSGKDAIVPIPTFSCNACGYINAQFLPIIPKNRQESVEEVTKPLLKLES